MAKFKKGEPRYTSANIPQNVQTFGDKDQYTVQKLTSRMRQNGRKELEQEYRHMRKVQMDRSRRIGKSEFNKAASYRDNMNKFPAASTLTDKELIYALHELDMFQRSSYSSVGGLRAIRDKQLATLHRSSFTFVNKDNYYDFVEFMNAASEFAADMGVTSDQIVELYDQLEQSSVSWRDIFKDYPGETNDTAKVFEWWVLERAKVKDMARKARFASRYGGVKNQGSDAETIRIMFMRE